MTAVRRVLIALPIVLAVVAVVYAVKPFSISGGTITDPSGRKFVALTSSSSCGAPIVAAWHGKDEVWAVPVGPNISGSAPASINGTSETEIIPIATCRSEAQHRLRVAGLLLAASVAVGGIAFASRRRLGFGPAPSPA